jgi:hypothetical protein
MRQWLRKSSIVLTLMTLSLIWRPAYGDPNPATPEPTVVVPTRLLREATARIDSLELRLGFALNRAVEQDSLRASEARYWRGVVAVERTNGDLWQERARKANGWWNRHESALWMGVGAGLAIWALQ